MPAPTPIQIRYGPAGLLAQAASRVGIGDRYAQQHAEDMQFINSRLANSDRIQQEVIAGQNQSANRLQQAYAQTQPQQSFSQPVDNNTLLKQTYLQSAANDLPDAEKANLTALAGSRMVSPDQFRLAVADASKRNAKTTDDANEDKAKTDYVQSILPNVPAEAQAGLLNLAKDKKTTAAQLRVAGDAVIQRVALGKRVQTSQQIQGLDAQARELKSHMDVLAKEMAKNGVDVYSATPAQLNPTMSQRPHNSSDFIPDAMTAGMQGLGLNPQTPGLVTGPGNSEQRPAYIAFQKMKAQLAAIQAKRNAIATGGGGGTGAPADPMSVHVENGGQIVQVNSPEEAANLPLGTAFVDPDGNHWVKHE